MPELAVQSQRFEPQTAWVPAQVAPDLVSIEVQSAFDIDPEELAVIDLISRGLTANQTAMDRGIERGDVINIEAGLKTQLEVPNTSAVVNKLIISGILPIELKTNDQLTSQLTQPDRSALRQRAAGRPDRQIARSLGLTLNQFIRQYEPDLYHKLDARQRRPHLVRRGHELGILTVAGVSQRRTLPTTQ